MQKIFFFFLTFFGLASALHSQIKSDGIVVFAPRIVSVDEGLETLTLSTAEFSKILDLPGFKTDVVSLVLPEEKKILEFLDFIKSSAGLEFDNLILTEADKGLMANAEYLVVPVIYSAQKIVEQKVDGSKLLGWKGKVGWFCVRVSDGVVSQAETAAEFPAIEGTTIVVSMAANMMGLLKKNFFDLKIDFRATLVRFSDNSLAGVQSYPGQFKAGDELTAWKNSAQDSGEPQRCGTFMVTATSEKRILLDQIDFDSSLNLEDVYLQKSQSAPIYILPQVGLYFPDSFAVLVGLKVVYEPSFVGLNGYLSTSAMYHILNPINGALGLDLTLGLGKRMNFGALAVYAWVGAGGSLTAAGEGMVIVEYGADIYLRFNGEDGLSFSFSMKNILSDLENSRIGFFVSGGGFFNL